MFIGEYNKSVILTYMGTGFALLAIFLAIQGELSRAMMCFVISGICDLFDGVVARRMSRSKAEQAFGIEIDSLCDMINFAALPAILLLTLPQASLLNGLIALIYVLAAVTRLAHFNRLTKGEEGTLTHFIGLPVTYSALVFPLSFVISQWLFPTGLYLIWRGLALLLAFLFVWNKPIPKPNKLAYIFFVLLAFGTLLVLGLL